LETYCIPYKFSSIIHEFYFPISNGQSDIKWVNFCWCIALLSNLAAGLLHSLNIVTGCAVKDFKNVLRSISVSRCESRRTHLSHRCFPLACYFRTLPMIVLGLRTRAITPTEENTWKPIQEFSRRLLERHSQYEALIESVSNTCGAWKLESSESNNLTCIRDVSHAGTINCRISATTIYVHSSSIIGIVLITMTACMVRPVYYIYWSTC
jgi:hypothetical protein